MNFFGIVESVQAFLPLSRTCNNTLTLASIGSKDVAYFFLQAMRNLFLSGITSRHTVRRIEHQITSTLDSVHLHSLPGYRKRLPAVSSVLTNFYRFKSSHLVDTKTSMYLGVAGIAELDDFTPLSDEELQKGVTKQINTSLDQGDMGRLFAVVYIRGTQHKVTPEDIIVVKNDFPPTVGDKIRLEKVLAVGGRDFTLFGRPMLSRDLVMVEATVVEKTLTHNRVWSVYRRKMNFNRTHLYREQHTMLVINSIRVASLAQGDTEGTSGQE